MAIEGLTPEQILKREIATGEPVIYQIEADGALEARDRNLTPSRSAA